MLTEDELSLNCNESWTRIFKNRDIRLIVWNGYLEIHEFYYNKLRFKLDVNEPEDWKRSFDKIKSEKLGQRMIESYLATQKRPVEFRGLFDMNPKALRKLYEDTRIVRQQFERKNIKFNLDIQNSYLYRGIKDRKLKAFIVAHSYVAWYEWTRRLLRKIFKAKLGKGPKDDKELLEFLDDYPTLKSYLDTTKWGLTANQIRNCVAHEKFYFDYKPSELVFMIKKEKRVRLWELRNNISGLSHFCVELLDFLKEEIGKKS